MARSPGLPTEEGAPVPKDAIDPALVKLGRKRLRVGIVTALGVTALCTYAVLRLGPDRRFSGEPAAPTPVTIAEITAGAVASDRYVEIEGEPLAAHAIRSSLRQGDPGLRLVPVRGSGDRVWIAVDGDGAVPPVLGGRYAGRLRTLDELKLADSVQAFAAANPRPVFATVPAVRAALSGGALDTVNGEKVRPAATDRVAFDVLEPARALVVVSFNARHATAAAWSEALAAATLPATPLPALPVDEPLGQMRFEVALSPAEATRRIDAAKLWAARVEPITTHHELAWSELAAQPLPATDVELVGVYALRELPHPAWVLVTTDRPEDFWYVPWIIGVLGLIGVLFAWALVRAVRRDLLAQT